LREFDDNRRISVTEDTLHCEEPVNRVDEGLDYFHASLLGQATLAAETWRMSWWGA
jgi:hypothetical protein